MCHALNAHRDIEGLAAGKSQTVSDINNLHILSLEPCVHTTHLVENACTAVREGCFIRSLTIVASYNCSCVCGACTSDRSHNLAIIVAA